METYETPQQFTTMQQTSNSILWKAAIIGILILVMLIPTIFINNLIAERQQRQSDVVQEVTSKWAGDQSLTGPYIFLNYTKSHLDEKGKKISENKTAILLPGELNVQGKLLPEIRTRSIYNVLLYRAELLQEGSFLPGIAGGPDEGNTEITSAKLCYGLTDLKGIEEKIQVNFNGKDYELLPGLPTNDVDSIGLSANIQLDNRILNSPMRFKLPIKIKGSGTLHFVPLSGNSQFYLQSTFANPSFDGNKIPDKRIVSEKGFEASWTFNKANLPFDAFFTESHVKKESLAFGVAMQQPSDQYAKTNRSVKYAILLIALSFSLFFIIELMQKKPLHPVQYCMVGIALIVFFTLLLSISEFIRFEWAYLVAATATVWLVTLYAKGHFGSWKTAFLFAGILSALYGFILVLISLEDTALLVGSIGLFLILALLMYASRNINWYTPVSSAHT